MKILIATDAWLPQINGVVRTLQAVTEELRLDGHGVFILSPELFRTVPCPTYPEIRLSLTGVRGVARHIQAFEPEHVHIATEGPIGLAVRRWCIKNDVSFTTSYHTKFPEYLRARAPIPTGWTYRWLRRFHNSGSGVLVTTPSMKEDLSGRGFDNLHVWWRGVDTELFRPRDVAVFDVPGPVFLYVGRLAVEKNIEAFLELDLPGSKVVVGDGPARQGLEEAFPDTHFVGPRTGEALAEAYASADVFVFPSLTDTFGVVLLEALASGLPVAAYPVTGPLDVVGDRPVGCLNRDLRQASLDALELSRDTCRDFALENSWARCAQTFLTIASAAHRP
ncbi:glycosyltransferase family 4 protein [Coralliovum pocilloporae]|uniref:glycosyltransferase family 4 protein n=1 Tax=Coralliovum pocilloporae TaxID=3066369 RepID=UPI003307216D